MTMLFKPPRVPGYEDDMADELGVDTSAQPDVSPIADASLDDIAPPGDAPPEATAKPDALDAEIMRKLEQSPPPMPGAGGPPPMPAAAPPGTDDARADKDAIDEGRKRDDMARLLRGIELGGKQLIAGVLHQDKMAELVSPESTNYEGQARADAEKGEAKRYQRSQGEIAAAHQRYLTTRQLQNDELSRKDKGEAKTRQQLLDEENRKQREISNGLRKEGIDATKENSRVMQGLAVQGMGIRNEEHEDKKTDREDAHNNAGTTFDGVKLVAPKGIDKNEAKEVHDKVGMYNAAFAAFDSIDEAIKNYVANPSITTFNDINSRSRIAAAAMTSAVGGGAMAEAEANAAIAAMGASPSSFLAGKALFASQVEGVPPEKAAAEMLSKLHAARNTLRRSGLAKFQGNNYAPASGGEAPSAKTNTPKVYQNDKGEKIRWNGTAWEPVK